MAKRKSQKSQQKTAAVSIENISDDSAAEYSDAEEAAERQSQQQQELSILNDIFKTNPKSAKYNGTLKYVFYAAALFLVLSLPFTDRVIELAFPLSTSWLILVIAKTVAFFIAFYILMSSSSTSSRS
jgi:uncharacterized membrane protein